MLSIHLVKTNLPEIKKDKTQIVLRYNNWNDHGYKTKFELYISQNEQNFQYIGSLKIILYEMDVPDMSNNYSVSTFDLIPSLDGAIIPPDWCSIGTSTVYYTRMAQLGYDLSQNILQILNDITTANEKRPNLDKWSNQHAYKTSLMRSDYDASSDVDDHAYLMGVAKLYYTSTNQSKQVNPNFELLINLNSKNKANFNFNFDRETLYPGRINVVIGKNGAGKTTLINRLPDLAAAHTAQEKPYNFNKVVVLTRGNSNYQRKNPPHQSIVYGGSQPKTISSEIIAREILQANTLKDLIVDKDSQLVLNYLKQIVLNLYPEHNKNYLQLEHDKDWMSWVESSFEDEFLIQGLKSNLKTTIKRASSGQKNLLIYYAEIFLKLDHGSLLLFDEPENSLHPSLLSKFLHRLHSLLAIRDSFAIITTHSPIVLQEVPTKYIHVLSRDTDNNISTHVPEIETFGEDITRITSYLFETDFTNSLWKETLTKYLEQGLTIEEITNELSGLPLGNYPTAYILSKKRALKDV